MIRRSSLISLVLLVFSGAVLAQDAIFDVTPKTVTLLKKGGKATLKAADGFPKPFSVAPASSAVATLSADPLEVTAKEAGEVEFTITHTATGQTAKVLVRVVDIKAIKIEGHEKQLVEGERRRIAVVAVDKDDVAIPDVPLEFKVEPTNVARVEPGPEIVATATGVKKEPRSAIVTVGMGGDFTLFADQTAASFAIKVAEPITAVTLKDSTIDIAEGEELDLRGKLHLRGKNGSIYEAGERPVNVSAGSHLEVRNDRMLVAGTLPTIADPPPTQAVTFRSLETGGTETAPVQLMVTINLKGKSLDLLPNVIPLARDGTSPTITASLFDRKGSAERLFEVVWKVAPAFEPFIAVERLSSKTARLLWRADPDPTQRMPRFVDLTATATTGPGSVPVTQNALIRILPTVASFAKLRVRLNIMDDRTVADLFGEKTAKEFFVARVRLNNNLKKTDDGEDLRGESILAFSESIEVAVGMEKRAPQKQQWWMGGKKSADPWRPMTRNEVELMSSTGAAWLDLSSFSTRAISKWQTSVVSSSPDSPSPSCRGVLTYRPYTFEMIVNSSDPRYERSRRAKTFRMLNGIGTLASFITSVAVPGPQSDIPLGIEKFSNLLIPGLQKLFPDIRDTQRQNIVSMTMQPIEEIPFGSDLSRVLFFPKGAFQGMLRGHETRISEICPHLFTIEVAVLDKSGKQTITMDASQ